MLRFALLLIFLFIGNSIVHAQFTNRAIEGAVSPPTRPIVLKDNGIEIQTNVSLEHINQQTDGRKFYYWLNGKKLMITQGGCSGDMLHGSFQSFYNNKQLKESGELVFGVKHAKWTEWTDDGYITKIVHWKEGIRHGETIHYLPTGKIKDVVVYQGGQIVDMSEMKERSKKKLYQTFSYEYGDNDY